MLIRRHFEPRQTHPNGWRKIAVHSAMHTMPRATLARAIHFIPNAIALTNVIMGCVCVCVCLYPMVQPRNTVYSIHKLLFQHLFSDKQIDLHAIIFRFMRAPVIRPMHMDSGGGGGGMGHRVLRRIGVRLIVLSPRLGSDILVIVHVRENLPFRTCIPSLKKCKSSTLRIHYKFLCYIRLYIHTFVCATKQVSRWLWDLSLRGFFFVCILSSDTSLWWKEHCVARGYIFLHNPHPGSVYKFLTFHWTLRAEHPVRCCGVYYSAKTRHSAGMCVCVCVWRCLYIYMCVRGFFHIPMSITRNVVLSFKLSSFYADSARISCMSFGAVVLLLLCTIRSGSRHMCKGSIGG